MSGDDAIASENEFASGRNNRGAMSNERTLANSDPPALRESLVSDMCCYIFVRMGLIDNEYILGDEDTCFQMYPILGIYLRAPTNHAVILDYDYGFTFRLSRDT
jgi:hypothetical protein